MSLTPREDLVQGLARNRGAGFGKIRTPGGELMAAEGYGVSVSLPVNSATV